MPYEDIAAKIGRAKDWARYAPNSWIIWTSLTPQDWYHRLKDVLKNEDVLLVLEITPKSWWGMVPANIGEWMRRERAEDLTGD